MHKFLLSFFAMMLMATSATAFNCINDYSGSNGCAKNSDAAGDCTTLGYSTSVPKDCERILKCPYNSNYQRCVKLKSTICPDGYSISYTSASNCGSELGWKLAYDEDNTIVNNIKCAKCECSAPSSCTWTNTNKGDATLTNICCNGNYQTCTSNCKGITLPANATCSKKCTACNNAAVCTDFTCNSGYTKSSDGKSCICATTCQAITLPANATCSKKCTACNDPEVCTEFTCNSGYTKSSDGKSCNKQTPPCEVGYYLNSDKTCTANKVSGKAVVGIVAYTDINTVYVIATHNVGLTQGSLGFDPENACWATNASPTWGENCTVEEAGYGSGSDGQQIVPSAIQTAGQYRPCLDTSFVGHWYLPTPNDWKQIFANNDKIDKSLRNIGVYGGFSATHMTNYNGCEEGQAPTFSPGRDAPECENTAKCSTNIYVRYMMNFSKSNLQ